MIDIRSVFLLGALACLLSMALLWAMRNVHPRSRDFMACAALGEALTAASLALYVMRGLAPDFLSIVVANTLGNWACICILETSRRMAGASDGPARLVILGVAFAVVQLAWGTSPDYHLARTVLSSVVNAGCVLGAMWVLRSRYGKDPRIVINWIEACSAVFVFAQLARLVATLNSGVRVDSAGMVTGNVMIIIVASLYALVGVAWAMLLVALVNGRLANDFRRLADTDSLTGTYTRRAFDARTHRLLTTDTRPAALLMLDLDHFKRINDTYGHPTGDDVLFRFGQLLRRALPETSILGRYGGEEFCALLPATEDEAAEAIAQRICALTRSMEVSDIGIGYALSVSIGMATTRRDGPSLLDLVFSADRRVYLAKQCGRDRVIASDAKPAFAPAGETAAQLLPV